MADNYTVWIYGDVVQQLVLRDFVPVPPGWFGVEQCACCLMWHSSLSCEKHSPGICPKSQLDHHWGNG